MLNSVGLQGPGLAAWLRDDLPVLQAAGGRVVVRSGADRADYARAAELVAGAAATDRPGAGIVALEVNVSCPNVEDRARMFAHSADATSRVMAATACGLPGGPSSARTCPTWSRSPPGPSREGPTA